MTRSLRSHSEFPVEKKGEEDVGVLLDGSIRIKPYGYPANRVELARLACSLSVYGLTSCSISHDDLDNDGSEVATQCH